MGRSLERGDFALFNRGDIQKEDFQEGKFGKVEIPEGDFDVVDENAKKGDYVSFMGQALVNKADGKVTMDIIALNVLGGRSPEQEKENKERAKLVLTKITKGDKESEEEDNDEDEE